MFNTTVTKLCYSLHQQSCATQEQGTSVRKYKSISAYYSFYVENSRGNQQFEGHCSVTKRSAASLKTAAIEQLVQIMNSK